MTLPSIISSTTLRSSKWRHGFDALLWTSWVSIRCQYGTNGLRWWFCFRSGLRYAQSGFPIHRDFSSQLSFFLWQPRPPFLLPLFVGVQLVLYTSCALFLWNVRRSRGKQPIFLLAYMTLLLCVETVFQIVQARTMEIVYIDNRNYPGGPWAFFLATQYLPVNVIFYATLFVLTFLADLLIVSKRNRWHTFQAHISKFSFGGVGLFGVQLRVPREKW